MRREPYDSGLACLELGRANDAEQGDLEDVAHP